MQVVDWWPHFGKKAWAWGCMAFMCRGPLPSAILSFSAPSRGPLAPIRIAASERAAMAAQLEQQFAAGAGQEVEEAEEFQVRFPATLTTSCPAPRQPCACASSRQPGSTSR